MMLLENIEGHIDSQWNFDWYTDWEVIFSKSFQKRWQTLLDNSIFSTPFYHPKIVDAWVNTYGGIGRVDPFFLLAKKKDGVVAFFPFVRIRTNWKQAYIKRIYPVGNVVFDYQDPVVVVPVGYENDILDSGFWVMLNNQLVEQGSCWYDNFLIPRIRKYLFSDLSSGWGNSDRAPYLELSHYENFSGYFQSRKKSLRTDVRRQLKRINSVGTIELKVYSQLNINEVLDWIPVLEECRKSRYPSSSLPRNLLNNLVINGMEDGVVNCSSLLINNIQVSWHVGFLINKTFYWYIPIYDMNYGHLSPGKIHLYHMLEWAYENDISIFDFLRGGESYKAGWTDGAEYLMTEVMTKNDSDISKTRRLMANALNKLGYVRGWLR